MKVWGVSDFGLYCASVAKNADVFCYCICEDCDNVPPPLRSQLFLHVKHNIVHSTVNLWETNKEICKQTMHYLDLKEIGFAGSYKENQLQNKWQ